MRNKFHKATYQSYADMKQRCYNPNAQQYKNYGARGIKVCDKWLESYQNFWRDMGIKPVGYTLDRIDVDGDYTPENCRWADLYTQQGNRRECRMVTFEGVTKCVEHWSREMGIHPETIRSRIRRGWPDELLFEPTNRLGLKTRLAAIRHSQTEGKHENT